MFRRKAQGPQPTPVPPTMGMPPGRASISSVASSAVHGGPPERINSITSIETSGTMETVKGKRRSGFLGLGRSKKDKEKDREDLAPAPAQQHSSFSVNGRQAMSAMHQQPGAFVQPNGRVVPAQQMNPQQFQHQQMVQQQQQQQFQQQQQQRQFQQQQFQQQQGGPQSPQPMQQQRQFGMPPNEAAARQEVPPSPGGPLNPALFEPVVELISYQPHKTYVASPPELEMIFARTSAGQMPKQGQPGSPSNDWDAVWLQLSGTSLSMWSMKETRAAAARGAKVPPTYFSITESSLELLNPLPPPPHRPDSHPHNHVFSLNTAGSNRLLFSCPTERELIRWSTGLRLASWERSRLEEIYTGHLIRSSPPPPPMARGRYEGWVRVRVMGGTEWHRLWLVLSDPANMDDTKESGRRTSLFGLGKHEEIQEPNTGVPMASFYNEPRTVKNKTSSLPVLTMTSVTQVYAVFPERVEVINQSNLMKAVGRISGSLVTIEGGLRDSGWALIMPEAPSDDFAAPTPATPVSTMLRWTTAFHDAFRLYGRPGPYIWDESDPRSLFFAYPQGELRGDLFLSIDEAVMANFRLNTPGIRAQFVSLVQRRLRYIAKEEKAMSPGEQRPGLASPGMSSLPPAVAEEEEPPAPFPKVPQNVPVQSQQARQQMSQQQMPQQQTPQQQMPQQQMSQQQTPQQQISPQRDLQQSSPQQQIPPQARQFGQQAPSQQAPPQLTQPLQQPAQISQFQTQLPAQQQQQQQQTRPDGSPEFQLPPLAFGESPPEGGRPLSPITEGGTTRSNSASTRVPEAQRSGWTQPELRTIVDNPSEQSRSSLNHMPDRDEGRSAATPTHQISPSQASQTSHLSTPPKSSARAGVAPAVATNAAAAAAAAMAARAVTHDQTSPRDRPLEQTSPQAQQATPTRGEQLFMHDKQQTSPREQLGAREELATQNQQQTSAQDQLGPREQLFPRENAQRELAASPRDRNAIFNNSASPFAAPGGNGTAAPPTAGGAPRGPVSGGVARGSISAATVSSGASTPARDFTTALTTPMASNATLSTATPHYTQKPPSPRLSPNPPKLSPSPPPPPSAFNHKALPVLAAAAGATAASSVASHSRQNSYGSMRQNSAELLQPKPKRGSIHEQTSGLRDEPAAMYLMNMVDDSAAAPSSAPVSGAPGGVAPPPAPKNQTSPVGPDKTAPRAVPVSTSTVTQPTQESHAPQVNRRPSGARALNSTSTRSDSNSSRAPDVHSDELRQAISNGSGDSAEKYQTSQSPPAQATAAPQQASPPTPQQQPQPKQQRANNRSMTANSDFGDAAAFINYGDQPAQQPQQPRQQPTSPSNQPEMRSSFAPSKAAAERRARAEAQAAQQRSVMNVPGGGRRAKGKAPAGPANWSGSETDESDDEEPLEHEPHSNSTHSAQYPGQSHSPVPEITVERRGSRALPPVPRVQTGGADMMNGGQNDYYDSPTAGMSQLSIHGPPRPRSRSPPAPHRHLPEKPQHALPQPPAARQNVWNANFAVEHGMNERKGTFVQLEEPSVTLTKAFTPGGLLSAGLQDKEDRSAKRQEEVARETGATLVNVASKPPPPATGLMGAVAAHERDRRNAGGIGATLTDRDRERRIAEERQRKIDELQRQQQEQMNPYGGGMYGAPYGQFPGYGMPPAMPPMGYNPYAAQQQAMYAAQMAYQQTMMAMSAAGSQMGDNATNDGRHSPSGSVRAASPFSYGGYGMMPPAPMSMYGFPQFMPGMPPMGGMPTSPGSMHGQLPGGMPMGGSPGMSGWQSPPLGGPGGQGAPGGLRTSMMENTASHNGSERDDRQAS